MFKKITMTEILIYITALLFGIFGGIKLGEIAILFLKRFKNSNEKS